MCVCVYVYIYMCVCVCVYIIYMSVCVYIYIYIYTECISVFTHPLNLWSASGTESICSAEYIWFEFSVFLLQDWLHYNGEEIGLPNYLLILGEKSEPPYPIT